MASKPTDKQFSEFLTSSGLQGSTGALLARTAPASPCSYRLSLEDIATMVSNWNMGSQAEPED